MHEEQEEEEMLIYSEGLEAEIANRLWNSFYEKEEQYLNNL